MGNRQHFVPRFYLAAFQSAPRRIHVQNLRHNRVVRHASLRDQCYGHRFYGDESNERAFAEIEGAVAPIIHGMRDRGVIPGGGTEARTAFLLFMALQLTRTLSARDDAVRMSALLRDVVFQGEAPPTFTTTEDQALSVMLGTAPIMAETLADLSLTLVHAADGATFVTNDHPVVKYNTYCEGITEFGVTGSKCRGLELFFPISPTVLLYGYDPGVYKLQRSRRGLAMASSADARQLNRLQQIAAHHNIYFHREELVSELEATAIEVGPIRAQDRPRITRAVDVESARSELIHQFWPMPQAELRLSFVAVRAHARRKPLFERARGVRMPYQRERLPPDPGATHRRFEVRSHH